jgi:hypothetical protein
MLKESTLEGRMKAKKEEAIRLLKEEAKYVEFCEDRGYVYELTKEVYGVLTKIVLSLKAEIF